MDVTLIAASQEAAVVSKGIGIGGGKAQSQPNSHKEKYPHVAMQSFSLASCQVPWLWLEASSSDGVRRQCTIGSCGLNACLYSVLHCKNSQY